MKKVYSLRKSRHILHSSYTWLKKKGAKLTEATKRELEYNLRALEKAIFADHKEEASRLAQTVEERTQALHKKSTLQLGFEIVVAIVFALLIATVVRQMWFELYEIPTGSMRPSFREQDRLTVSKTQFGLNVPLETKHWYFDPDKVERGKVIIFSGANIPSLDEITKYFGVLPYSKRYIKRMIGKPGDTLYFYGGKIYGVDKNGNPLDILLDDPWMQRIEHIPFITFEGELATSGGNTFLFNHFDQPVGKLTFNQLGTHRGEIYVDGKWQKERPLAKEDSNSPTTFKDFWGIGNFAMARLLSKEDLKEFSTVDPKDLGDAELYLQLKHSPNLSYPSPRLYKEGRYIGVQIPAFESIIPLKKEHIDAIMDNMYTSRFVVEHGKAHRYSADNDHSGGGNPNFKDIPDGTYEFFKGKGEKIGLFAWASELPTDHPLNKHSIERTKELFNIGIEMFAAYEPYTYFQIYYPHRYAYYRDGDLYLLNAPILKKDDPTLIMFVEEEKKRGEQSSPQQPYFPFIDSGPPLKNGKIDVEFVKKFGVKIPEKRYVALGDNHAMSKDSRLFGFVPEENLQGVPSLLLWPPGERWGMPPQTVYPLVTVPRLIVWSIVAILLLAWYLYRRYRMSQRLFP